MPPFLAALFAVFVGGIVGSSARLAIEFGAVSVLGDSWPYGVLIVNVTGSFFIGWAVGHGLDRFPDWARTGVTAGVLGSFTTLSALSLDIAAPTLQDGIVGLAVIAPYAIGSVVVGLIAALWGLRLGQSRRGERA